MAYLDVTENFLWWTVEQLREPVVERVVVLTGNSEDMVRVIAEW